MIAALVAAQYLGTFDFSDRTDVRYRVTEQSSPVAPTTLLSGVDLSTMITARARIVDRRWEFTLAYIQILTAPAVIQFTPEAPGTTQPLPIQSAVSSIAWHSRRLRLTSTAGGTYGQFNSAFLYPPLAEGGQPVLMQAAPKSENIYFLSWFTDASAALRIDYRSNFVLSGGYQASGQLDAPTQPPVIPREYGPHASGTFDFTLDRADHLVTSATATLATFSSAPCAPEGGMTAPPLGITCSPESEVAWVQEEVRHQASPATRLSVGAGIGESEVRHLSPGAPANTQGFLVASASVSHTFGAYGQDVLLASAQLLPVTDALTGDVSDRLQGSLSLTDILSRVVTLRLTATGVQSILPADYPFPVTLGTGEVQATFKLNRWVDVAVGDLALWENEKNIGSFASILCYVAMTVRAETLHF